MAVKPQVHCLRLFPSTNDLGKDPDGKEQLVKADKGKQTLRGQPLF